jgi:hypothetical protein
MYVRNAQVPDKCYSTLPSFLVLQDHPPAYHWLLPPLMPYNWPYLVVFCVVDHVELESMVGCKLVQVQDRRHYQRCHPYMASN